MGGIVSTGEDNDDLIDNLKAEGYIQTDIIEDVFRAIDRADYYMPDHRDNAYRDSAWKLGHLHLSAPCIYTKVMENLKLEPSLSFLNLGSGTGYLSSMVGLILGHYGINHGIEIHDDVVQYAKERLSEFRSKCHGFDAFEFCEPQFIVGNCLLLESGSRLYDRVYCGTACPPEHENFMKNLIRVGGILVMPINDQLLQITRLSETEWETKSVLPVSFATLIAPSSETGFDHVKLPPVCITSLQDACRATIRRLLRAQIKLEHPELRDRRPAKPKKKESMRLGESRISVFPMSMSMMILSQFDDIRGQGHSDEDDEDENDDESEDEVKDICEDMETQVQDDNKKDKFSDIFTDDIDCEDNRLFYRENGNKKDTSNGTGLVLVSDYEGSDTDDNAHMENDEDDDDDDVGGNERDVDSRRVLNINKNNVGLSLPCKSGGSYSTSADTETSGLGTFSDHSDDQLSLSLGRSPDSHMTNSPVMTAADHSESWNIDSDESKPIDCTETPGTHSIDRSADYSRSLDSGRDELMSDLSLRCNFQPKKMRTLSENDGNAADSSKTCVDEKKDDAPVVKVDYFRGYMIDKVKQLPIPMALQSYLMFYHL